MKKIFSESVTSWRLGNLEYGEEMWGMNEDALTYHHNWSKECEAATRAFTLGNVSTRLGHAANPQQVDQTAPTWCSYWCRLEVTKVSRVQWWDVMRCVQVPWLLLAFGHLALFGTDLKMWGNICVLLIFRYPKICSHLCWLLRSVSHILKNPQWVTSMPQNLSVPKTTVVIVFTMRRCDTLIFLWGPLAVLAVLPLRLGLPIFSFCTGYGTWYLSFTATSNHACVLSRPLSPICLLT